MLIETSSIPTLRFVLASSLWLHVLQYLAVSNARKSACVPYPLVYVSDAKEGSPEYICIQRAHQQLLENLPTFLASTAIFGLRWPHFASVNGCVWIFARLLHYRGYSTGVPKKRESGAKLGNSTLLIHVIGATIASFCMMMAKE